MLCSLGQAPVPSRLRASVGDANHSINAHRNLARQTLLCSRPFRLSSSSLVRSSKSGQPPVEEPVAASEEPVEQGQQDGHRRPFQRLREWVGRRAQALSMSQGPDDGGAGRPDTSILRLIRLGLIVAVFFCVALARELVVMRGHVTRTREVFYSEFATLLDAGWVRAARMEQGTGRLFFELRSSQQTQGAIPSAGPASEAVSVSAAPTAGQPAVITRTVRQGAATAGAAATSAAASVEAAAGAASTSGRPAPQRFKKQYMVKMTDKTDAVLVARILAAGVEFAVFKQSFMSVLTNTLMTALAVWIPLCPFLIIFSRLLKERSDMRKRKGDGKSQAVTTTFKDVAGVESAKQELMEVVTVMKSAKASYSRLKVKMPSGVLLCGPPGTGKTLLARAVAGEAGVPFMAVSASEFVELFVGRGAARIRELFAEARKVAPCVVFIDELDALGARRGMGYNDERDQTLNQLLTELDGFEGRQGVLFLAATNRVEILDPALLRPGRINRKVVVPLPDEAGRRDILAVHLRTTPMSSEEDKAEACERLARVTAGFSGAELANVVNEATLLAARNDQEVVTLREMLEGVRRTKFGVNGKTESGVGKGLQKWLMDVATSSSASDSRKVKTATAG